MFASIRGRSRPNRFGTTVGTVAVLESDMSEAKTDYMRAALEETGAPENQPAETLDVRQLGPPKPLTETLERLVDLEETVLVQVNDRAPQHLYPKLEDRGYTYETVSIGDAMVTTIWEA
jgi:uncharacterized protein (DUF2249 family)